MGKNAPCARSRTYTTSSAVSTDGSNLRESCTENGAYQKIPRKVVTEGDSVPPNRLYYGDNLQILRTRVRDESVHLCYIDPPFNSQRNYNQIYNRVWERGRGARAGVY